MANKKIKTPDFSSQAKRRFYFVLLVLSGLFLLLIYRLFTLAYFESDTLIKVQNSQILVSREITPPRGDILDRNGKPLAKDTPLSKVVIDPKLFHDDWCLFGSEKCESNPENKQSQIDHEKAILTKIAKALNINFKRLLTIIVKDPKRRYKVIAPEVSPDIIKTTPELASQSPYLYLDYYYRRFYPLKEETASLLGMVDHQGEGISGLEKSFNSHLKSEPGKVLEKYSGKIGLRRKDNLQPKRKVFYSETIQPANQGQSLRLSIDSYIQHVSFQIIANDLIHFGAKKSSAVVVDVNTGEIIALTDFPSTNPNNRKDLIFDYTVSNTMAIATEPGSVIKPLVIAGLLDKQLITTWEKIDTAPGHIYIDKWLVKDSRNYKTLTPSGIIKKSSNVGMVKLTKRIGGPDFSHFLNTLGLNETSGIFPGLEAIGNLGNAWQSDVTKLNQSYGYGLEVTLLALARAYVALAREGELIPLTILAGHKPKTSQQVVSADVAKTVLTWMQKVTEKGGTGTKAALDDISVAGKTGTVRARGFKFDTNEVYNNSFVGIFPAAKPRYLILVNYQHVYAPYHYGGNASAISFKKIAEAIVSHYDVAPVR